jgi:hypothetical protein
VMYLAMLSGKVVLGIDEEQERHSP